MPDFTQYVPPGVFVEEDSSSPLVTIVGVSPAVVGIVGPAIGYLTHVEAVVLTGTTAHQLAKQGVNTSSVEVRAADGTLYTGSDYVVAQSETGAAGTADNWTTLTRSGGSTITSGATVYVTYHYTDTTYNQPYEANDYDTVKEVFGEPLNLTTGAIISPLSMAAKLSFDNGAARVVLVATPTPGSASRAELSAGTARLSSRPDVNIIVPLPVGLTGTEVSPGDVLNVGTDLKSYVESAADNKIYAVGVLGYETTITNLPTSIAGAVSSERVMLAWPNKMQFYNGFANQILTVAGYYLAAALAGQMAARPVQTPLTHKLVRGFAGLPPDILAAETISQKNIWSAGGVAVIEPDRHQNLVVRHGVSTNPASVLTREMNLTRAKDAMMQLIADTIDAAELIGSTIDAETPLRIKGVVAGCLSTAVNSGVIESYETPKVRQSSLDPTVIEVKFRYKPSYALNYIVVSFSINTATGEIAA